MFHESISKLTDVSHNHVQESLRNSGFLEYFGDECSPRHGCVVMRFEHDAIPGSDRWCDRAHAEIERKVERTDHANDSGRDPVDAILLAVDGGWQNLTGHAQRVG